MMSEAPSSRTTSVSDDSSEEEEGSFGDVFDALDKRCREVPLLCKLSDLLDVEPGLITSVMIAMMGGGLLVGWGAFMISTAVAVVNPARGSMRAIRDYHADPEHGAKQLERYWVCLGGIILVESISLSTLLFHFPLWYIAKVALVLYLQMEKCPGRLVLFEWMRDIMGGSSVEMNSVTAVATARQSCSTERTPSSEIVPTDAMSTAAGPSPSPSPDSSGKHIALLPLSYHHRIAEHIESKLRAGGGALVVMGQGLGVCELVSALLRRLQACRPVGEPLILIMNAREGEAECIGATPVTADVAPAQRDEMYLAGGCLSITSRILVTDLLTNRLTTEIVAGVVVLNAHGSSHCEQFACELYRERKQKGRGFIAAFTDNPIRCRTLMNVESLLRELQIGSTSIVLVPRFRSEVMDTFKPSEGDANVAAPSGVRVLSIPLPAQIAEAEKTLNTILEANFEDISKSKGIIDAGIVIFPQGLPKGSLRGLAVIDNWFTLRSQLSMVWDQLGRRTQNMIRDADALEKLAHKLRSGDATAFFVSLLESISAHPDSPWVNAGATHQLISQARQRLYNIDARGLHLHIDPPPKWAMLQKAINDEAIRHLKEQQQNVSPLPSYSSAEIRITVVTHAQTSSYMTKALVDRGPEAALLQSFQSFLYEVRSNDYFKPKVAGSALGIHSTEATHLKEELYNMSDRCANVCSRSLEGLRDVVIGTTEQGEPVKGSINVMVNVVDAFKGDGYMSTRLAEFQPNVVILYDAPTILPIRVAERYTSHMKGRGEPLVHTVIIQVMNSHESRRLSQSGVQEQQAFHDLISMEKSVSTSKPKDEWQPLMTPVGGAAAASSSRAGGRKRKREGEMRQTVLVDVRELRSNLPLELHRKGLTLLPYTLPVGDFILSRDICIERKALPDLIGSLGSGRLYRQAVSMSFNYRAPCLLVEVQETEAGALMKGNSARISDSDTISRLVALVLHFPSLRLMWSLSDRSTANLFVALKVRAVQQPDPVEAMKKRVEGSVPDDTIEGSTTTAGTESGPSSQEDLASKKARSANPASTRTSASEILLNCPGITPHILTVLRNSPKANTLKKLVKLDRDTMTELMGPSAAKTFHKFVNTPLEDKK